MQLFRLFKMKNKKSTHTLAKPADDMCRAIYRRLDPLCHIQGSLHLLNTHTHITYMINGKRRGVADCGQSYSWYGQTLLGLFMDLFISSFKTHPRVRALRCNRNMICAEGAYKNICTRICGLGGASRKSSHRVQRKKQTMSLDFA